MLRELKGGELPYAFGDYFPATDYWKITEDGKIYTLPNEKCYYINY